MQAWQPPQEQIPSGQHCRAQCGQEGEQLLEQAVDLYACEVQDACIDQTGAKYGVADGLGGTEHRGSVLVAEIVPGLEHERLGVVHRPLLSAPKEVLATVGLNPVLIGAAVL